MRIDNKIGRLTDGPALIIGLTFCLFGLLLLFNRTFLLGAILFLSGIYLLFSYNGVEIDTTQKQVRTYQKLFGLYKYGNWKSLDAFIGVTLVPIKTVQKIYSRSNRTNVVSDKQYRIYLVDRNKKPSLPIKCCKDLVKARNSLDEFAIWLKLPVYSVRA